MDDSKGRTYLPRTRKTRALLAVLAMASPRPVLRQQLASLLWSRREQEQARGSLRQSVHELQDALGPAWSHLFVTDRHYLSLRGAAMEIDVLSLAQPAAISVEILGQFEDVLLEDLNGLDPAFDRWLDDERARFRRIGRAIGESLLAKCEDPIAAIGAAEQLLAIDRTHEGAWRTIMRSHAERGDLGAAATSYERCRGILAENLDGRPSPETEDLIGRIRAQASAGRLSGQPNPGRGMAEDQAFYTPPRPTPRRDRSTLRLRVAPLRTIGTEHDDGLALGLAEEISAGLSRFRWISCVPGSFWPGMPAGGDASAGGLVALEADLVLDGTIQYGAGRVRIIVRLIDMRADGEIAWAGRFDRSIADPLSMQDELGAAIVAQVDPELMKHEGRRTAGGRLHDMTAQDLLLQALPALYRLERVGYVDARRLLEASLRVDPGNSVAHGWLAYWNLLYVGQGWATDPGESAAEAARLAERAVMLDPGDARALTLAGHVRGFLGKHPEEASALHERAIALNPNLAIAWCFSGLAHFYMGRHEEALRRINQAIHLSPSDPHVFFFDMALIMPHLMRGDCASAVEAGRRAIELNPLFSSAYKGYLAALGWIRRPREAREVLDRLLALEPGFSIEAAVVRSPLKRPEDIARYAEGLRLAGLRERNGPLGTATLAIEHSVIDLVVEAPHSPVTMLDGSYSRGKLGNDTNW
ncbi:BTAD domain-containing putative transcriptional regulator [Acidisphaera sp. S103]|uniref:BTAD domain-containing putative transcriptional regulator n=1 Tax=Acidisphaera sp. S103 TaxID=1747223 RepID=UPI00131D5401|nr:BTAD domain-containing putative transcriptional regulator [Acidisphaera sp. S103]